MAALNAYLLIITFLLIKICEAKLPKEYQIDKSKWKNPSDHYTRISITDENDENICTSDDDSNCETVDFYKNHHQQQEWLFAWITVAGGINFMIISTLFLCFVIIYRKRTSSISLPSDTEQIIPDSCENISTKLQNLEKMDSEAENTVTEDVNNLELDDSEKKIDKNTNLPPKIEFENEFDIFGPIESESEKEIEEAEKILTSKIDPFPTSSSTTTLLLFDDDEPKIIPTTKIDISKIYVKPEITSPSLNNPTPHDPGATTASTDDDEDFFVISKKEDD